MAERDLFQARGGGFLQLRVVLERGGGGPRLRRCRARRTRTSSTPTTGSPCRPSGAASRPAPLPGGTHARRRAPYRCSGQTRPGRRLARAYRGAYILQRLELGVVVRGPDVLDLPRTAMTRRPAPPPRP